MKLLKSLTLILLGSSAFASGGIHVLEGDAVTFSSMVVNGNVTLNGTCTGTGCGGGGGGTSALGVNYNGVSITSPTAQINFIGAGVSVSATGSTATVTVSGGGALTPASSTVFAPYGPGVNSSGNFSVLASSQPRCSEVLAPYPGVTVSSASAYMSGDTPAGSYAWAVYSSSCGLLAQTNTKTAVGVNIFDEYFTPNFTFTAGTKYFICFASSQGATTLFAAPANNAYAGSVANNSEPASNYHYFDAANLANLSGGVLTFPATCGTRSSIANQNLAGVMFH